VVAEAAEAAGDGARGFSQSFKFPGEHRATPRDVREGDPGFGNQKSEIRNQKSEVRSQKSEQRIVSDFCLLISGF
jgi:hypothetical protein